MRQTVVFHLSQPDVPILTAMSDVNAAIVPASEIKAGSIGTKALGSGPFKLDKWDPNAKEVLSANKDWAGGKTGVDGIEISVLPDEAAILAAMRTKQIDFALLNDPLVATLVPKEASLQLNRVPGSPTTCCSSTRRASRWTELKVRQAISCAIDRQEVLDTASLGEGKVTGPLTIPALRDRSEPAVLLQARRRQGQEADGRGRLCRRLFGHRDRRHRRAADGGGGSPGHPVAAGRNRRQARHQDDGAQRLCRRLAERRFRHGDRARTAAGPTPTPCTTATGPRHGNLQKVSNYIDDTLDSLLQQGRAETDPAKRKAIFAEFEKHLAELSPWIWLYTSYSYTAQQKNIAGFVPTPTGTLFSLSKVTIQQ